MGAYGERCARTALTRVIPPPHAGARAVRYSGLRYFSQRTIPVHCHCEMKVGKPRPLFKLLAPLRGSNSCPQFLVPPGLLPYRACQCTHILMPLPFRLPPAHTKLSAPPFSSIPRYYSRLSNMLCRSRASSLLCKMSLWFLNGGTCTGILANGGIMRNTISPCYDATHRDVRNSTQRRHWTSSSLALTFCGACR